MRQHLIVYAKRPIPGRTKTRLGAEIGHEAAAGIYARMLYTYLANVICHIWTMPQENALTVELSTASPEDRTFFERAFPELLVHPQIEGDLGSRMAHSFTRAFDGGADAVVLTGSDIPGLTVPIIRQAFAHLRAPIDRGRLPGVIGPAADGGYYLIGMRAPGANLFEGIAWSTPTVCAETQRLAEQRDVHLALLPELADIDVRDDYETWLAAINRNCQTARADRAVKNTV